MESTIISTKTANEAPTKERWIIVGVLMITLLVAYLDRVNVAVLLADNVFLTDMGIKGQPVQMGLLMTLFLIAYGIGNVVLSPVGDLLGPRKAMSLSIILWALSLCMGGIAATFTTMLVARFVLGLGEGIHWPMQSKYVKNWFPPSERGKANAWWALGLMIGPAITMPVLTWIVQSFGWRESFFVLMALGLIPLLLLWFRTTDHPKQHKKVNAAELDLIEKGLKEEAEKEAHVSKSSLWDSMKTFIFSYRFWLLTLYYLCHCSVWWGTMAWLPSYLKVARGFSWAEMGAWATLPYIIGAIFVLVSGWLSDRVGRRAPFSVFSLCMAAICIYGAAYVESNNTSAILISFGIGAIAIGVPCAWSLAQEIIPANAVGAGSGMMNGLANGGSAFAPVLIGLAISVSGGYVGGLMFLVGSAVAGAICIGILALKGH